MLNQGGIASAIAGNWEMTTTALARTGFPVNVLMPSSYTAPGGLPTERPDLVQVFLSLRREEGALQSGSTPRPLQLRQAVRHRAA